MHFRTGMCGGEPCSGSSGTARNFGAPDLWVAIFPCEGGRDEAGELALGAAFDKGGAERVTRLYLRDDLPETNAGCARRAGAWLTADAPGILHPDGPGRGGGRAVGSVFPLEGGIGLRPRIHGT